MWIISVYKPDAADDNLLQMWICGDVWDHQVLSPACLRGDKDPADFSSPHPSIPLTHSSAAKLISIRSSTRLFKQLHSEQSLCESTPRIKSVCTAFRNRNCFFPKTI